MTPEMVLLFTSLIKGVITVIAKQMELAGATKAQIDMAIVNARDELDSMDPANLPKQAR